MALVWAGLLLDQPTDSSGSGMGRMNFRSATFAITNPIVASYDAGTHGNPAVAPSPVAQGWTETRGAGTSVGGDPLQVHVVLAAQAEMASMKLQHVTL